LKLKKVVLDGADNNSNNSASEIKEEMGLNNDESQELDQTEQHRNCKMKNQQKETTLNECLYGTLKIYLESLINLFPNNIKLNIIYSYIMTYYLNNIYKALFELMKVSKRKLSLHTEFEIFFLNNEIEKIMYKNYIMNTDNDFHIENVLKYNDVIGKVLDLMNKTAVETISFWTEIGLNLGNRLAKNSLKIYEHAVKISKNIKSTKIIKIISHV
jgi:hypothetical protein